ncbi:hypothetical protein LMG28614_03485 [Paraburkholderia ultramafica]|uniref:Uncharacterized protein n=1 Tax=Paraburkholderia ultramafica TaxID=1544867 RepID=A0A6S7BB66_9BURK|nr:hypothetical protein [Paraburkholderia ultramafica]CAB3792258.1 hypothetical protein LMG28614_03485 [Paraburkholderia ultramafica]
MGNASKTFRSTATFAAVSFAAVAFVAAGSANNLASAADAPEPFAWPASLAPFGNGYPNAGDACRRLGESPATSAYLDHMATLVGCPGGDDSASVRAILHDRRGHVVGEADGVTLISIPTEGTMGSAAPGHKSRHAQVKGTAFSATGTLPCARRAGQSTSMCRFGVVRNSDRTAIVTVYWPGGGTRTIFFGADGTVVGTATRATDRPMPGKIIARKNADVNLISIGDERYEIAEAILSGG